ncbi:MAG: putative quinol monooxygenase [Verrucomicrobiota bacterium]
MPKLTVVANITAKSAPESIALVKSELEKLIEPTRSETGCLQYDLHQDNEEPARFLFFENWENRDLWQNHLAAPHITAFKAAADDAIEDVVIFEMTQVG